MGPAYYKLVGLGWKMKGILWILEVANSNTVNLVGGVISLKWGQLQN